MKHVTELYINDNKFDERAAVILSEALKEILNIILKLLVLQSMQTVWCTTLHYRYI